MKITPLNKENMLKWIDELTPDEATLLQGLLADPEIKAAIKEVAESNTIGAEYKWTKSEYSEPLYKLLSAHQTEKEYNISIDTLRNYFHLGDKYKAYKDLRINIIDRATTEIRALTDMQFDITPVKTGKKYTGYIFTFRKKKTVKKMTDEQKELLNLLLVKGYRKNIAAETIKKYDCEYIRRNIQYTDNQAKKGQVNNYPAFLHRAIENDWGQVPAFEGSKKAESDYYKQGSMSLEALNEMYEREDWLKAEQAKAEQAKKEDESQISSKETVKRGLAETIKMLKERNEKK